MNEPACKLVIVDDEPIILRSLKVAVPWERLGISLVGQARNAEEALRLIEQHRPEIVISDIRMPAMDGITLMRVVMKQYPDTVFILLSGYGEFEYAREAIRHGAFNYLLKPIDHEELEQVVVQAKERIAQTYRSRKEHNGLKRYVELLSPLVRERLFTGIIEGTDSLNHELIDHILEDSDFKAPYYMGLVSLDDFESVVNKWSAEEKRLWYFAVHNILQEYLLERQCYSVFPFYHGEWLFIMQRTSREAVEEISKELISIVKYCTKLSVSIGISSKFEQIHTLHDSYRSCQRALSRRFAYGGEQVYVDESEHEQSVNHLSIQYPHAQERALSEAIRTLNWAAFDRELGKLHEYLSMYLTHKNEVSKMVIQLVVVMHRQLEAFHSTEYMKLDGLLQRISTAGTLDELISAIRVHFAVLIQEAVAEGDKVDGKDIVKRVIDYVEDRYHQDIGIDEVAEYAGLSSSHFCVIFKQETGATFLEYLTKHRIEKACTILRNSDVKVFQVAPLVGYRDPRYFTQVFKKLTGKTPSEFRLEQTS